MEWRPDVARTIGSAPSLASPTAKPRRTRSRTSCRALEPSAIPAAQADRRNVRGKLAAGWRGFKAAVRGDSSFFAHFYRGTLVAITAALLGINQWGWCLLVLGATLVLLAELTHSAVDTLAKAVGDPETTPRLKTAGEIAAAGVLVAVVGAAAVALMVLSARFLELLGWRL